MTIVEYIENNKYDLIPDYKLGLIILDKERNNLDWSIYYVNVSYTNNKDIDKETTLEINTRSWSY